MNWYDFFFSKGAFQNYVSELFGILFTLVIIDQAIRFRERIKMAPLKQMSNSLVYDEITELISHFVPVELQEVDLSNTKFGDYETFIVLTIKKNASQYEIGNAIRSRLNDQIKSIKNFTDYPEIAQKEVDNIKSDIKHIMEYENKIKEMLLYYGSNLENKIRILLNDSRIKINKHFSIYKKEISEIRDYSEANLTSIVPDLIYNAIEIKLILEKAGKKSSFFKR